MLSLVSHALIGLLFILGLIPMLPKILRDRCQIIAHTVFGLLLLVCPGCFLSAMVTGEFNVLHTFLQRFASVFHIGLAYFFYSTHKLGLLPEQSHIYSRAIAAFFSLFTKMFAAWHLTDKSTRGLLVSDNFIFAVLLTDGVWFVSEIARFVLNKKSTKDEVDDMCKRTTLWIEGRGSFYAENSFYIDATMSILLSMFHFAFPNHILKLVIRPEYNLDSHHIMWCRIFGCLSVMSVLSSLNARNYPAQIQIHYTASRLVMQTIAFALNVWGHWILGIYSPNHITGFMLSGFYMSFLFSTYFRLKKIYMESETTQKHVVTARVDTVTIKSKDN